MYTLEEPNTDTGFYFEYEKKTLSFKKISRAARENISRATGIECRQTSKEPTAAVPEGKNSDLMRVVLVTPFWYWESSA